MNKYDYIFLPINDANTDNKTASHWSLMLLSNEYNKCYQFDSSYKPLEQEKYKAHLEVILNAFNIEKLYGYAALNCFPQKDNYDCGIHVIRNAVKIAMRLTDQELTQRTKLESDVECYHYNLFKGI